MKTFRKTKVDRALRRSMLTNGGEPALILASRAERTIHLSRFGVFTLAVLLISLGTSNAQNAEKIAQQELERRQAALPRGEEALVRGKSAMQAKNFTLAHEEFRRAVNLLPDARSSSSIPITPRPGAAKRRSTIRNIITTRKRTMRHERASFGRSRKAGKNPFGNMDKPSARSRTPSNEMSPAPRASPTNSTASSFRASSFATRAFARRLIFSGNKRPPTIRPPKGVRAWTSFCV